MSGAWWRGFGSVTAEVDCGGAVHRIRWHRGRLALCDHDPLAESTLEALGGDPPRCLEVLEDFRRAHDHDRPPPRLPGDLGRIAEIGRTVGATRRVGDPRRAAARARAIDRMRRAVAEAVEASLAPVRVPGRPLRIRVRTTVVPPGEPPAVDADLRPGRMQVHLTLPLTWLTLVWGRGAAVADGHLVLDVGALGPGRRLAVRTLRWIRAGSRLGLQTGVAWIEPSGEGWRMVPDAPPVPRTVRSAWATVRS